MAVLIVAVGFFQSWALALTILNLCLISAIMALGVNIQWGYAGLFNVGIMGFAALGGVAAVLVSMPPVPGALAAGGWNLGLAALADRRHHRRGALRRATGRRLPARAARPADRRRRLLRHADLPRPGLATPIEAIDPAAAGYLGGLGLPILLSWLVGGLFAAGAAWLVGKIALGLRSDYLAIATLGIAEIILAILKNENWLTRGVKNVTGLPRPVPDERALQQARLVHRPRRALRHRRR